MLISLSRSRCHDGVEDLQTRIVSNEVAGHVQGAVQGSKGVELKQRTSRYRTLKAASMQTSLGRGPRSLLQSCLPVYAR